MDLAQMKAAVTMEGVLSGAAALELIAEVEQLTEQIKAGMQPLANKMSEYAAENARLTALCDGYRGGMEALKAERDELNSDIVTYDMNLHAAARLAKANSERAEKAESALTRANEEIARLQGEFNKAGEIIIGAAEASGRQEKLGQDLILENTRLRYALTRARAEGMEELRRLEEDIINSQRTVSMMPTVAECSAYNKGLRDAAEKIACRLAEQAEKGE